MYDRDERFMQMALRLAKRGIGSVEPNPAVGCIIVKDGRIIGKGRHKKFGGPHAEINALQDCKTLGVNPRGATMYVTLEPCRHYGKTPPCTDAIIAAGIAKVVAATIDPSPHANGAGMKQLREAGIEARTGVCETEARILNAPFIKFAAAGKCWVILKWAQSIDGKVAYASGGLFTAEHAESTERELLKLDLGSANSAVSARWISNELSRKDAHRLRRRVQGILVGVNTVIADDPLLTARPSRGKKPARIVLDTHLRIPLNCRLLATAKKVPVLIVTNEGAVKANSDIVDKIAHKGAELLTVPMDRGRCDIESLLDELSRRGVTQLLVEGGPTVLTSFLKRELADEICVYITPKILGSQGSLGISEPMAELSAAVSLHYVDVKRFADDIRLTGLTEKALRQLSIRGAENC
ncbi:MAG: bifunctional diaminohydroxyphosphoribosylaminopyrimidine deaminase/5-amino-6-(5-phosphoribosylamino)uracil reductase RibD [Sedimentisphaerales bacterium]|nr:bifunctional diaminohydroxyphosphoribosylaminopyrimidine deaminase/5-amino-6-(5-phosphoribosylamino)uracil reductase RibD [Sedimentisphaerales bacterium]